CTAEVSILPLHWEGVPARVVLLASPRASREGSTDGHRGVVPSLCRASGAAEGTTDECGKSATGGRSEGGEGRRSEGGEGRRARRRVLIVDDEEILARCLADELGERHEAVIASGGREAVARLLAEPFDAVLCDVMMPDMSGLDVYDTVVAARPYM